MTHPTVAQAFDAFMQLKRANVRTSSADDYAKRIRPFIEMYMDRRIDEVSETDCLHWIARWREQKQRYVGATQRHVEPGGLSLETIADYTMSLKAFWRWTTKRYHLPFNPMEEIRVKRNLDQRRDAADPEDVRRLLDTCGPDAGGVRDRAILILLSLTGFRRFEAAERLCIRDVDFARGLIKITGKGGRTENVVMLDLVAVTLKAWLKVRPDGRTPHPYVFCSVGGARPRGEPLFANAINQMITRRVRLVKAAGGCINGPVHPHAFRHMLIQAMVNETGDIYVAKVHARHKNIGVTERYVRPDYEVVRKRMVEFDLINKLIGKENGVK